ncbi:MAG: hypothetical protein ACREPV_00660 [Lysobacter sp.]
MSDIRDNDLILYRYRDGLTPERLREIERALAASPALAARYRALQRMLAHTDRDIPPQPDAQFESRLWQRLQPRLDSQETAPLAPTPPRRATPRPPARPRRRAHLWSAGLAAAAVLVIALYFPLSRDDAPQASQQVVQTPSPVPAPTSAADRAFTVYVAAHLRSTEGVLLSVINNTGTTLSPAGDDFVHSLVGDNRLYAAAAAKHGDQALAGFLESLDPMLIELANQPVGGDVRYARELRDFVRNSDVLFQVRAVEARLQSRDDQRARARGATT